jgi:transcriptional regulator with XRE-family HTH domain
MEAEEHPGKKIRFLLHTHSMTIQQLANEIRLTCETLREIVDEEAVPTPHVLQRITGFFGLRQNYFGNVPQAPAPAPGGGHMAQRQSRNKRKIDLRELAVRHQALLNCLVGKKCINLKDYETQLEVLRAKIFERENVR